MRKLDMVTKGPSGLVKVLNKILSALNGMKITGIGIWVTPTDDGWIISTVPPSSEADGTTTGGSGGDSSLLAGATWTTIDVMDSSCVRSTIQVLTKSVGS